MLQCYIAPKMPVPMDRWQQYRLANSDTAAAALQYPAMGSATHWCCCHLGMSQFSLCPVGVYAVNFTVWTGTLRHADACGNNRAQAHTLQIPLRLLFTPPIIPKQKLLCHSHSYCLPLTPAVMSLQLLFLSERHLSSPPLPIPSSSSLPRSLSTGPQRRLSSLCNWVIFSFLRLT